MSSVLRYTGGPQLYSFYRHFAFNLPRLATVSGVVLLLGIGAIRLYLAVTSAGAVHSVRAYLTPYFALVFAVSVLAAAGMLAVRTPTLVKASWALGSLLALATFAMYLVSRTAGLPGMEGLVGKWDYPLGTFSLLLAAGFFGLHLSVVTGVNVAMSWRSWHD